MKEFGLVGMKEQTCHNFKKSGNLSGEIWIGNTKRGTYKRSRVCHRYTTGWLFGHCTRTCEHHTCTATGTVSAGNRYSFFAKPAVQGVPAVF
jgi:hypothetical protein